MMKIDKIFGDKKGNKIIYILLAMGILLLALGSGAKTTPVKEVSQTDSRSAQAERILSEIKGVGEVRVMISEEEKKKESVFSDDNEESPLCSVLIVADGASDVRVRERIVRAATAALGVEPHKIEVFERKE